MGTTCDASRAIDWDINDKFDKGLTLNTNAHFRWTKIGRLGAGAFGTVSK